MYGEVFFYLVKNDFDKEKFSLYLTRIDKIYKWYSVTARILRKSGVFVQALVKLRMGYHVAINLGQKLWSQEVASLVIATEEDESRAWEIFVQYEDKGFSFTDCTSFAIIERLKIDTAFAFDDHFIQYGKFMVIPT